MILMKRGSVQGLVATLTLTAFSSGTALAGARDSSAFTLDLTARYASGDLNSVRAAFDSRSRIGCSLNSDNVVSCTAVNIMGTTATCSKYRPDQAMVNAVLGLASDGYLYFAWDSRGVCTQIITETSSRWAPKQP